MLISLGSTALISFVGASKTGVTTTNQRSEGHSRGSRISGLVDFTSTKPPRTAGAMLSAW